MSYEKLLRLPKETGN